jgi:hypothetical protein
LRQEEVNRLSRFNSCGAWGHIGSVRAARMQIKEDDLSCTLLKSMVGDIDRCTRTAGGTHGMVSSELYIIRKKGDSFG